MAQLKTPIICTVIGEGGSGGALALGGGDHISMLQYSIYSVISPEGCASILWKSAEKASEAAETLKLTAKDALELKLVDRMIEEPLGGAHRDVDVIAESLSQVISERLTELTAMSGDELVKRRHERLMSYGAIK